MASQNKNTLHSLKNASVIFLVFAGICFGQSTWESIKPLSQTNSLYSVTYGNGMFVAVGDKGLILTSPDGRNWTKINSGTATQLSCVTFGNGQFLAGGGSTILTSLDGSNWTIHNVNTFYGSGSVSGLSAGQTGQFVAVSSFCSSMPGAGCNFIILTSPDGATWTQNNAVACYGVGSVTYGNGHFVAAGSIGNGFTTLFYYNILTSSDGATWINKNGYGFIINRMIYVNNTSAGQTGQFFAFAFGIGPGDSMMTSLNGTTWTTRNSGLQHSYIQSMTYGNGRYVAMGYQSPDSCCLGQTEMIFYSTDATTWTIKNLGTNVDPNSVTFGNGLFVAVGGSVGDSGRILISKADPAGVLFQPDVKPVSSEIKINSANNLISAILPYSTSRGLLKVGLFNVSGRRIYSATVETHNGILNIPAGGFPVGKYFLSITDEKNRALNSTFVLTR